MKSKLYAVVLMLVSMLALTLAFTACQPTESVYYTVQAQYDETLGTVTVSDPASENGYAAEEEVMVTVVPNRGVEVKRVTLNGVEKSLTDGKLIFEVSQNTTVAVTFEKTVSEPEVVTLTLPEDGTVTAQPAEPYHAGDKVTLTIDVPSDKVLKSLKVNGVEKVTEVEENALEIELSENTTVVVEYDNKPVPEPEVVTLTLPQDGTVTAQPAGPYHAGDKVTLTIAVPSDKVLKSLKVNGVEKVTEVEENALEIELSENTTVVVEYDNKPAPEPIEIGADWQGYFEGSKTINSQSVTFALRISATQVELKIGDGEFGVGTITEYKEGDHITFTLSDSTWKVEAPFSGSPYQSVWLSGGPNNISSCNCLRKEEPQPEPEIPELTIPEKLVGVWTTADGDHTMTITSKALTLDDVPASAFTSLEEASTVYYNFTAGGKEYTMMFGSDGSLSVAEVIGEGTGPSIQFTVKDGQPIVPQEVEIKEEFKGEFEGEKSGTKYRVSVTDEGIFVTIGDAQPVKATLKRYEEVRGYTFTLDGETEYRLAQKGTSFDKLELYYGSGILDYVDLNRVTETEPTLSVDDELVGVWRSSDGEHTLTITKTSIDLDGKKATAYQKGGILYSITIDGVEYSAMLSSNALTLIGGDAGSISFTLQSEQEPSTGLQVDAELVGEWVADGHTLTITETSIVFDGKSATEYHKDGLMPAFTMYMFTVEGVEYTAMFGSDNTSLRVTGGDIEGNITFTLKSEQGGPDVGSDVAIPDKYCGVFSGESGGKTYVITVESNKVTITIDGTEQAVTLVDFEENGGEWNNTPTITITLSRENYVLEMASTGKYVRLKNVNESGTDGNLLNVKATKQS